MSIHLWWDVIISVINLRFLSFNKNFLFWFLNFTFLLFNLRNFKRNWFHYLWWICWVQEKDLDREQSTWNRLNRNNFLFIIKHNHFLFLHLIINIKMPNILYWFTFLLKRFNFYFVDLMILRWVIKFKDLTIFKF